MSSAASQAANRAAGDDRSQLRRRLRAWYRRHARDLPWRRTYDPYAIWVSEIMLQQTTVAAVIPYYERFLSAFPDIASLAAASQEQVLRLWEGLGYYRRARQLHAAAGKVVDEHGGEFPQAFADILALPGIGKYTAGAIASFAFDEPRPIVEANTARLYARLMACKLPLDSSAGQAALWQFAAEVLPRRQPGEFNQALMELGATVCTPKLPDCPTCPLAACCETRRHGWQEQIPLQARKTQIETVQETVLCVKAGSRWLLVQRGPGERWAGMWDFPRAGNPSDAEADASARTIDPGEELYKRFAVRIDPPREFAQVRHAVTRFRITLRCLAASAAPTRLKPPARWFRLAELAEMPLTTPARRIVARLATLSGALSR